MTGLLKVSATPILTSWAAEDSHEMNPLDASDESKYFPCKWIVSGVFRRMDPPDFSWHSREIRHRRMQQRQHGCDPHSRAQQNNLARFLDQNESASRSAHLNLIA